jgi:hypothetical protein
MHAMLSAEDSEAGVRSVYRKIIDSSEKAALGIQSHVYAHYTEFVLISKEISKLESDMLQIHGMIQELQDLGGIWNPVSKYQANYDRFKDYRS